MLINLVIALAVSLVINLLGFFIAFRKQSDKLTDAAYSISFLTIAIVSFIEAGSRDLSFIISLLIVGLWAIRLGSYLVYRVIKNGKDRRFDDIRSNAVKFCSFWLSQAAIAWLLMLPIMFETKHSHKLDLLLIIGVVVWAIGFVFESLADYQKGKFKANPKNKNRWIDEGVWHYSRHPNYFGEIMVWIGVYLVCFSALTGILRLIALVSPIIITMTLRFVSGVPPTEKSADKRWGDKPDYIAYKKRTNLIIPFYNK
jgi:steroid 5-alpha reductase family enzyme